MTWAYRRRALVIGAAFCILAVSAEGARRLSFETDVLTLLPRDGRVIPAFRSFLSTFGSLDQLYVVFTAPDGYPIADYSDRIDAWIDQLRACSRNRSRGRGHGGPNRAISAGSRIASCSCSTSARLTKRSTGFVPKGLTAAVAEAGASS